MSAHKTHLLLTPRNLYIPASLYEMISNVRHCRNTVLSRSLELAWMNVNFLCEFWLLTINCWYLVTFIFPQEVPGNLMKVGRVDALPHSFSCVVCVSFSYQFRALLWKKEEKLFCASLFFVCKCAMILDFVLWGGGGQNRKNNTTVPLLKLLNCHLPDSGN